MDFPTKPLPECSYDELRVFLHAFEKGEWRLEKVRMTKLV
jgi:hypothetical protein